MKIKYIYTSFERLLCVESIFLREKLIHGAFKLRKIDISELPTLSTYDYFSLFSRYCGNMTGEIVQYLPEDSRDVRLRFHSDSTKALKGFYTQLSLKPGNGLPHMYCRFHWLVYDDAQNSCC